VKTVSLSDTLVLQHYYPLSASTWHVSEGEFDLGNVLGCLSHFLCE
jgi:hypothetical protein